MNLEVPASLYHQLGQRTREAGFATTQEYVLFVLQEVTREEEPEVRPVAEKGSPLSPEEEKKVEERLRGLGYID